MISLFQPDDSKNFFKEIKTLSNDYWKETDISSGIIGYQIQNLSKWNEGLSEKDFKNFENEIGIQFPTVLKNFFLCMNGLSKPGINIYACDGRPFTLKPVFYSYPNDLNLVKDLVDGIYNLIGLTQEKLGEQNISRIFPVFQHRFMLIDEPGCPIISIIGDDVIYWADNLSKMLANEIFGGYLYNVWDFESNPKNSANINFWLD